MKKLLSILLAALLVLSVMPMTAFAAEADETEAVGAPADSAPVGDDSGTVGDVTWYFENATGELTIGGTGELQDYNSGYETPWAAYRNSINTITIGGSITRIGSYAFEGCTSLCDVIFITPLDSIGDCAFLNCGLASVTLTYQPCDLEIGEYAFAYEGADGEITNFVSGFTIYSDSTAGFEYTYNKAFMHFAFTVNEFWGETDNCHWSFDTTTDTLTISPKGNGNCAMDLPQFWARDMALTHFVKKLVISEGLTTVSNGAFFGCNQLEEVTIPDTLTQIGQLAFSLCTALTTVNFPASLHEIGTAAFARCDALSSITLYSGLQTVGIGAFKDTALTSVIIPSSVTFVGDYAFGYTEYNSQVPEQMTPVDDFVVYGESGTAAATYADNNGFTFFTTTGTTGDCLWAFDPYTQTLTVSGEGAMADYETPYDHVMVNATPWAEYSEITTTILIEDGVTHVGNGSFYKFYNVTELTIGNNVQTVGEFSFYLLRELTEVVLPDSVEALEAYSFTKDAELQSITFGKNLKRIGTGAFSACYGLTEITLPDSLEWVDLQAFVGCHNLTSVVIGECPAEIRTEAFLGCGFTKVYIPESVTEIIDHAFGFKSDSNHELVKIDGFTIYGVPGSAAETYANEYEIPFVAAGGTTGDCKWKFDPYTGTLTISGEGAMADYVCEYNQGTDTYTYFDPWRGFCDQTTKIVIEDGVTHVGEFSFCDFSQVTELSIGNTVQTIGRLAFSLCGITVPDGKLTEITIPDSVESIGKMAFASDKYLQSVTLGSGLKNIGEEAFAFTDITELTLPDSVETIGDFAFMNCAQLTSVALNEGVTSIGEHAFLWCPNLTEVYIPDSVTAIGEDAFGYNELNHLHKTEGFTIYGSSGTAAETYAIENGFTFVALNGTTGDCQWKYNRNTDVLTIYGGTQTADYTASTTAPWHAWRDVLTAVVVQNGVTKIGDFCFYDLPNLTDVNLPDTVTAIGTNAFRYCEQITSLSLPAALSNIGTYAFGGTALTDVTIPDGVTTIPDSAFGNCVSLTAVTFNEGLTTIEAGAFVGCPLIAVSLPFTLQSIGANAFLGANINSVTIPPSVTSIGQYSIGYYVDQNHATVKQSGFVIRGKAESAAETYATENGFTFIAALATGNTGEVKWAVDIPKAELIIYGSGAMGDYYSQNPPWMYVDLGKDDDDNPRQITKLTVRDGVTYIGDSAFSRLTELTTVKIGKTLTSCGTREPFYGLTKLYSVAIADGVTTIPAHLFENCTGNSEDGCYVVLPSTLTAIGSRAFYNFENLRSLFGLNNANSLTTIGDYACYNCKSLSSVYLPNSVTEIGSYAFYGCENLQNLTMSTNVQTIGSNAFARCQALPSVTLPETLTTLGSEAFASCTALTSVNIPANMTVDGVYGPFSYCDSLNDVTFTAGRTAIPAYLFHRCTGIQTIELPDTVTTIGRDAFAECSNMTAITLPDDLEEIGYYVFQNCSSLQSLTIPDGVTTLYNTTFYGCSALETITLPDAMTTIENSVFANCSSLQSFTAPAGVTIIKDNTFKNCTSLSSLTLHGNITAIEGYAFDGCSALETLTIPEGVKSLGNYSFRNCTALETVNLPSTVCGTGGSANHAFEGCTALRTVNFANGSTRIPGEMFRSTGITEISFPDTVTDIEGMAFTDCADLTTVTLPSSLQRLGNSAFSGCPITEITIPKTLTNAGDFAQYGPFSGCEQLKTVHFEAGSTQIAASLFSSCTGLEKIVIPDTITTIGNYAFFGTSMTNVLIPITVTSIGTNAFGYERRNSDEVTVEGFTIYGFAGSAAQTYADANEIDFVPLLIGDANGDSKINVLDVTAIQRHIAEIEPLTGAAIFNADANGDGEVTIADVTLLLQYLAEFDGIVLGKQPTA